jgi:hypothetical protein
MITDEVTPVPLNATICGLPVALSAMFNVAARAPAAPGVNSTLIVQLAPAASVPVALQAAPDVPAGTPKSPAFVPVIVNPLKLTAAVLLFVTVTLSGALVVVSACDPNIKLLGVRVNVAVPAVPVPAKVTVCGLPEALSVKVIAPVRVPAAVGLNEIWNTHGVASTAMLGHCASVAPAKSPEVTMLVKVTAAPPVFEAVTVCVALVVPTAWLPNESVGGAINIVPVAVVLNVAVTVSAALIATVQVGGAVCGLAGLQGALKLVNVEPVLAVAVSTTALLPANVAEQVVGQLIPAGALVTVPEPLIVTVNAAAPMPERVIVCTLPAVGASSVIVTVPV